MATAKKLPSGKYRVRSYSHTDSNGKKIYKSFTAATKKVNAPTHVPTNTPKNLL